MDACVCWLTGYSVHDVHHLADSDISIAGFYSNAPAVNPNADLITGMVCGVRVEAIEDPLYQQVRRLDKMIDELAQGKALDKILRT